MCPPTNRRERDSPGLHKKPRMMNSPNVLIISTKADTATDDVVRCLAANEIQHYRLNTEDYPFQHTLTYRPGASDDPWLWCNGQPLPLPTSIWYRRLRTSSAPDGMDEGIATFCRQETRAALVGSVLGRDTRWMSHPADIWQAEYKPYQLDVAARHGLTIPRTLITNDPSRIRLFATSTTTIPTSLRTANTMSRRSRAA